MSGRYTVMATTNAPTYETESVDEAEGFYPYGGQRIDTKTNYGGEKRNSVSRRPALEVAYPVNQMVSVGLAPSWLS
jgi:hypothetical protein